MGRCPTNNDPTYDKQRSQSTKLYAISTGSRKKVTSLDNIDTKTNTVITMIFTYSYLVMHIDSTISTISVTQPLHSAIH